MALYPKHIDAFDSYSQTGGYTTTSGTVATSTTQYFTPDNSLKISNYSGVKFDFDDGSVTDPTDEWAYEFKVYFESSTSTNDFFVQFVPTGNRISQLNFDHADGKIRYATAASTFYDVADFSSGEWITIRVEGTISGDTQDIYVNGTLESNDVDLREYVTGGLDCAISFNTGAGNPNVYIDHFYLYTDISTGTETVSGVIQNAGSYAAYTVRSYRRSDGMLVDETTSSGVDGTYTLSLIGNSTEEHFLIAIKDADEIDVIDRVVGD